MAEDVSLAGLTPIRKGMRIVEVPFIPMGVLAQGLREKYEVYVNREFGGNAQLLGSIRYDKELETLTHSNFFGLNVLGQVVRAENPNFDVTSRADLLEKDVVSLISGTYVDTGNAIVLKGDGRFYSNGDEEVFKQLAGHVDDLETPVLLEGLDVVGGREGTGYKLRVVPNSDFRYTHDENEFGIKGGWGESLFAISGLYRYKHELVAGRLVVADRNGRVVLVSRGVGMQNLEGSLSIGEENELLRGLAMAMKGVKTTEKSLQIISEGLKKGKK
ncbi:MAG: hypothetical protein Q8P57_01555 [Candidatus Pacearchaeota archaeon]|nr:hypothetical protein [Candidatus Pacearchaeota archaeon]